MKITKEFLGNNLFLDNQLENLRKWLTFITFLMKISINTNSI
jgi:hypothetical protein